MAGWWPWIIIYSSIFDVLCYTPLAPGIRNTLHQNNFVPLAFTNLQLSYTVVSRYHGDRIRAIEE